MTVKEAIYMLRNAAWLGSDADRQKVEEAVEVVAKAIEAQDMILHMNLPEVSAEEVVEILKRNTQIQLLPPAQPEPLVNESRPLVKDLVNDTISRQNAIELAMQYCPDDDGTCSKADEDIRNLLDELENLPPAQPEQSAQIQDILQFLDERLHPIVSPENWGVYSELHDMISGLSSTQLEPNCKGCKHLPRYSHEAPCKTCANNYINKYERYTR